MSVFRSQPLEGDWPCLWLDPMEIRKPTIPAKWLGPSRKSEGGENRNFRLKSPRKICAGKALPFFAVGAKIKIIGRLLRGRPASSNRIGGVQIFHHTVGHYPAKAQRCHLEPFMEFDRTAKKHLYGIPAFFKNGGMSNGPLEAVNGTIHVAPSSFPICDAEQAIVGVIRFVVHI